MHIVPAHGPSTQFFASAHGSRPLHCKNPATAAIHASSTISKRPSFSTGTPKRSRSDCTPSGNSAGGLPDRLFGHPSGHRDHMWAGERQEAHRLNGSVPGIRVDQDVELHPGALCPTAGSAPQGAGRGQHPRARGALEVAARQIVVFHEPAILRSRSTARPTTATAVSTSDSLE